MLLLRLGSRLLKDSFMPFRAYLARMNNSMLGPVGWRTIPILERLLLLSQTWSLLAVFWLYEGRRGHIFVLSYDLVVSRGDPHHGEWLVGSSWGAFVVEALYILLGEWPLIVDNEFRSGPAVVVDL